MSIQLSLTFGKPPGRPPLEPARDVLVLGRRQWPVMYVRHLRARHYILRLADDGSLRVTIPRGGSRKGAERFARGKAGWIEREQYRREMARGSAGSRWDASLRPQAERELPARLMELAASTATTSPASPCATSGAGGDPARPRDAFRSTGGSCRSRRWFATTCCFTN